MADIDRMGRIEQRQVETNAFLVEILGVLEVMSDSQQAMAERMVDLDEWLKEPPKSDLPDLLKRLTTAVELMLAQIVALPEAVARTISAGELDGRG